jgi:parallel beta-helix repeat protein
MSNNQYGITVYSSTLTSITNNRIENSIFYGIHLHTRAENNTIKSNIFLNNKYGIHVETSNNNNITLNTISSTTDKNGYGIRLTTSNKTRITGNTIQFNYMGIVLWENSVNNIIHYNNFLNNTQQQYHSNTSLTANIWDTDVCPGARGNYWSDYAGTDNGSGVGRWGEPRIAGDGVGDTLIPHQGVDYYPLMTPWSPWPVARFTYTPEEPHVGEMVTFDASASSGDLVSYNWNFGDGSAEVIENDPVTTHVFEVVGNYTVTLTVIDREGSSNSTLRTISVLPYRVQLDVYTQKQPYSGKGFNQTSDAFSPQELVMLFGLATYNDEPVKDKIVSFNIFDPDGKLVASRSNVTDEHGIATVSDAFRIQSNATFGTYTVVGTAEIAGYNTTDYLRFDVGWIISITGVETVDSTGTFENEFAKQEAMYVNIFTKNIAFTSKDVTLTIVVYDNKSTPIAVANLQITVDPGWAELKSAFTLIIPGWALIGQGSIYVNAYTDWLWNNGVPYSPEYATYVVITP